MPDDFAKRIGINSSGFYKLLRGEYAEPRQATFDKIAAGLGMTPAELLVAVGGGSSSLTVDEIELLAAYREVEPSKQPTIKEIVQSLRAKAHPVRDAKARRTPVNKRSNGNDSGLDGSLESHFPLLHRPLAFTAAHP